jgi:carboxymethylenebutenolidase
MIMSAKLLHSPKNYLVMRLILTSFTILLVLTSFQRVPVPVSDWQQEPIPMCHPSQAIADFAAFASDPRFGAAHTPDFLLGYQPAGTMVKFPVPGGTDGQAYLVKAATATNRYLLMIHEWWGLNDNIKREADEWAKSLNVNVLAVDLYDGKLATSADEAGKLMQANSAERSSSILLGAAAFAGKKAKFQTMGWCFGGGWSLQAALLLGKRVKGCVMYYGMPEKDLAKLKTLKSKVLFIHASKDQWITDAVVAEFETNMKKAKKQLAVQRYDADHAFANPTNPRYQEQAAKAAREVVANFLK